MARSRRPRITVLSLALYAVACGPDEGSRGPARIIVWTNTRGPGALHVVIDDGRTTRGDLTSFFSYGAPTCADTAGSFTARVSGGAHRVTATDGSGRRWRATMTLAANECRLLFLAPVHGASSSGATIAVAADSG